VPAIARQFVGEILPAGYACDGPSPLNPGVTQRGSAPTDRARDIRPGREWKRPKFAPVFRPHVAAKWRA
jgi:hypothetical protein